MLCLNGFNNTILDCISFQIINNNKMKKDHKNDSDEDSDDF